LFAIVSFLLDTIKEAYDIIKEVYDAIKEAYGVIPLLDDAIKNFKTP